MTNRSLKRRWLRTKMALGQTVDKILSINRRRKWLSSSADFANDMEEIDQELKVLNKIADHQARLLKKYETEISTVSKNY